MGELLITNNQLPKKDKIKLFFSIVMIFLDVVIFLILHGTSNLYFVKQINNSLKLIPSFDGISWKNKYINGYLVDVLWIFSFNLLISILKKRIYQLFVLITAITLETLQLLFKQLGTFDFIDIVIYSLISIVFIINIKKTT